MTQISLRLTGQQLLFGFLFISSTACLAENQKPDDVEKFSPDNQANKEKSSDRLVDCLKNLLLVASAATIYSLWSLKRRVQQNFDNLKSMTLEYQQGLSATVQSIQKLAGHAKTQNPDNCYLDRLHDTIGDFSHTISCFSPDRWNQEKMTHVVQIFNQSQRHITEFMAQHPSS